ncbi:hypothetical protein H3C66_03375 [Patescibacteria group bacterium]|nr:hypothetical protein [Patescibacteria group bacterium]
MPYVITCGDEGVQINEGTRLGIVGAGFRVPHLPKVIKALKKVLGEELAVASSEENNWIKQALDLSDWDQVNAMMEQHVEAMADREGLLYAGMLPFTDPRQLKHDIKGHMVRPQGIHIATKISFTLAGGEQKYHLGCFVISAEWVSSVPQEVAEEVILTQVKFYRSLVKKPLQFTFEETGSLDEKIVAKNKAVIEDILKNYQQPML